MAFQNVSPVLVTSFQARTSSDGVELQWVLEGDDPIAGIDVYRFEPGAPSEWLLLERLPADARHYVDSSVALGRTYRYILGIWSIDGAVTWSSAVEVTAAAPARLAVRQYPNPFNPATTIEFELPAQVHIVLTVHDTAGRRVRTITNGLRPAGKHHVTWDGKDEARHALSSGVYFYRLVAGAQTLNGRMTLLR